VGVDSGPQQRVIAGRYAVDEVIGRGGMGTVWSATDQRLQRRVAMKEVTFSVHLTEEERTVLRERTMREARAAARLDHPCVTTVFDVVEEDGRPWLVMEHVPAPSLQDLVEQRGALPPQLVARIGLDVLSALEAAHAEGIVHRDVKPANVLVCPDGRARLTDFGIATTTGDSSLTTQGALIGSPSYMAPERAVGGQPAPSVDLWSLGATLYTAAEGRLAFDRGDPIATLMAVATEPPAPMTKAGPLAPVLSGLLTKDPMRRATVAQARRDLQAVAGGRAPAMPWPSPPPPRPAAGQPPPQRSAPPPQATPPPQAAPQSAPRPAPPVERIDADDLRRLAEASRAVLGTVARDGARYLADRHARKKQAGREGTGTSDRRRLPGRGPAPAPARSRRRFKRRWLVVPTLSLLLLGLLAVLGVIWLIAVLVGMG
jgi:eukaryotic-like serine/threonine-protein kinase